MRMRRDHNATKKKRQTSYDWCRCCHRKMFTRNTRNSIARIVKKNIFHFFFLELESLWWKTAWLAVRSRCAHILNDLHSVITEDKKKEEKTAWQVSYWCSYGCSAQAHCDRCERCKVRSSVITRISTTSILIFFFFFCFSSRFIFLRAQRVNVVMTVTFPSETRSYSILHSSLSLLHELRLIRSLSGAAMTVHKP